MKKALFAIIGLAAAASLLYQSTFVVNQGEFAVVTQFGKPVRIIEQAGLYLKYPLWVQKAHKFDRRLQLFQSRLSEYLTKDKKNLILKCYVQWQIEKPKQYFESLGNFEEARQRLEDILISKGGAAIGDFEFEDLVSLSRKIKIKDLEKRIQEDISQSTLALYGIKVVKTGISQLALPPQNANSVYNRMKAERKAIANKYRAEGQEKAAVIRAEANREKAAILARAYEESQKVMGKAEATAARTYSRAFGQDPEFYEFWRTMQTYGKILDNQTTLILSEDSKLFKYLKE